MTANMRPCWVCGKPLDTSEDFIGWDGTVWFLASPGSEAGLRATHLRCSPDAKVGAPMTSEDEAALDAGFNPWKVRRDMGLEGE
jgi:hypothetical protein